MRLGVAATAADLANYDEVVIATGVVPRNVKFPGSDDPRVLSYIDVLKHNKPVGKRVALIGAGGIGFDVAEKLSHDPAAASPSLDLAAYFHECVYVSNTGFFVRSSSD